MSFVSISGSSDTKTNKKQTTTNPTQKKKKAPNNKEGADGVGGVYVCVCVGGGGGDAFHKPCLKINILGQKSILPSQVMVTYQSFEFETYVFPCCFLFYILFCLLILWLLTLIFCLFVVVFCFVLF